MLNAKLRQPVSGMNIACLEAKNVARSARIREANSAKLSAEQQQYLLEIVDGTRSFLCSTLSGRGRTLYVPGSDFGIPTLKMKGAGGLERATDESLRFHSPQPNELFTPEITHVGLTPSLTFFENQAKPKAYNSLRIEAARMEFRAQMRLHKNLIGFDGLIWGEFLSEQDIPEVDANGYGTGFSIMEHDLAYRPLSTILTHYGDSQDSLRVHKSHDTLDAVELDTHFGFVERIGAIKRSMAMNAELGSHSSTADNFLYNKEEDRLLITDTDTVVDYREMESPFARGSQFLRDSVSDLSKRISEMHFIKHTDAVTKIVREVALAFLHGLFGDSVTPADVRDAVSDLGIESTKNFRDMHPELYRAIYRLLVKSELRDVFEVQTIDPDILYERARSFFRKKE